MFWRSVVGKLWGTILLLVSFVLLVLTILLVEFFGNFQIKTVENDLTKVAQQIVSVTNAHSDKEDVLQIASELIGKDTKMLVLHDEEIVFSSLDQANNQITPQYIKSDPDLLKVFKNKDFIKKEMVLPNNNSDEEKVSAIVVGVPLSINGQRDQIFLFQSLESMEDAVQSTTRFILLAAGIAIVLTTIFAFFLSTRINAPLRKMREAALAVARGKFDTKVPILTQDEIGELAIAFNQMAKQLKYNITALSEEKEHLSSILSSMADGVITFNKNGTILEVNPPAERFLQSLYFEKGFNREESNTVPQVLMNLFDESELQGKEQNGEITIQGRDWGLIVSPLYSSNHASIRGAVAIIRDMTDARRMDKLRTDFIANVSHELRTPISMLQGYSEALIDDIGNEEDKKEMSRIIYDESLRMGRLVNDLLDLAKLESGNMHLTYENIELAPYLKRIASKFQVIAREKGIQISANLEDERICWDFDPDRIEQVLTNLIDNAIRHTPYGGIVEVGQKISDRRGLIIYVQDSGSGIPEEDLPFVFERFYKADKARTRGTSGTGLGLSIAKKIIATHEGFMSVNSKLNEGTVFSFVLPRKTNK